MVYKKYLKKGDRIFGPYYYESYRSGNSVKKHYIGSEKEYREWLKYKKQKKRVEQPIKKSFNFGMLIFLFSLIVLIFVIGIILGYFFNVSSLIMVGFAVSPNSSYSDTQSSLLYGDYEQEAVVEQFNTEIIDLEIKNPTKFAGEPISKNKNKRMDFDIPEGKIRLYFDLLNYSEFVESVENIVVAEEIKRIEEGQEEQEQEPVIEINITLSEENISNIENITETNVSEPIENITEETSENISGIPEIPTEPAPEPPAEETPTEEIPTEPAPEPLAEETPAEEPGVTGNIIKGITGFVARIIGFDVEEQQVEQQISDETVEEIKNNINVDDIKEKVGELSKDKIENITENSVIEAEDFDVNVTNAEEDNYKWGYKIKLNELNFMAKIDITSDQSISVYNSDTLRIGNALLSFNDLVKAGYIIKIEKPVLESEVFSVNISEINLTVPEGEIEEIITQESNITEETIIEENITEEVVSDVPVEPVEPLSEENITEEIPVESSITEPTNETPAEPIITGNIIKGLTGIYKLTGKAVDEQEFLIEETEIEDIEYKNSITIYIEKDFNEYNKLVDNQEDVILIDFEDIDNSGDVSIGDIVSLDPSLIIIEISKAEHLDENRSFISDIYNDVKEKDDNWSEVINNNEYVRVTFNQSLTNQNDITIYARASNWTNETNNSNETEECYDNETEILTLEEVDCSEVDCNDENVICDGEIDALSSQTATALSLDASNTYNNILANNNENSDLDNNVNNIDNKYNEQSNDNNITASESNENKEKDAANVASKAMQILADYNISNDNNYLNVSGNEKNNGVNLTPTVKNYSLDNNNYEAINYINFSVDSNIAEEAELILTVRNRSEKSGLFPRHPGSTPGLGASALSKKCYREKWEMFSELEKNEKVMTLNAETGKREWQLPLERQVFDNNKEMYKIILEDGSDLLVSEEHKVYANENYLDNNMFLSPIKVNPSNFPDSDCLAIMPEPKSKLSAFSGLPNEMYNTSASSSYSNDILSDFSINSSILSSYLSIYLNKKQSEQNHLLNLTLCKQLLDICFLKQGFCQTSLLQEENLHLLAEQDSVCLEPLLSRSLCLASQDELCKYVSSAPLSILLEHCLLKMQHASFGYYNFDDYINFSIEKTNLSNFKLQKITETYQQFNEGKEIYFLDAENNPVRIKSIEKQDYNGKIYDVDVENDIVLVRRNSEGKLGRAVWSGNSNPVTTSIEVYVKNNDTLIAKFENITQENWYKVYLNNLSENESYDVFDLKINCDNIINNIDCELFDNYENCSEAGCEWIVFDEQGFCSNNVNNTNNNCGIEFDYIIDPTISESSVYTQSNLVNVTAEIYNTKGGGNNFTHLNISNDYPYNKLFGYWNFDGDQENLNGFIAYDFSVYSRDIKADTNVIVNSTNCIYGDCLHLDYNMGINGTLVTAINNNNSFMAWFRPDATVDLSDRIIFSGDVKGIRISSTSTTRVQCYNSNVTVTNIFSAVNSITLNQWNHVACVHNSSNHLSVYVNGILNNYTSITNPTAVTTWDFGTRTSARTNVFNGSIDEIMIFNTSLNSDQILAIYNNQSARFATQGTQDIVNQSYMNISTGNNKVNVTTYVENNSGSSINLSVGYYNVTGWFSTTQQRINSGVVQTFTISSTSTNLTLNYTFYAGNSTNPFYSPIIKNNISFEAWNEVTADTTPPNINFTAPTPGNGATTPNNSFFVNVSSSDTASNISTFINFDNSLKLWWRMDDVNASGDVVDYFGMRNGSKKGNATQTTSGKLGDGFSFDGSDDYVTAGSAVMTGNIVTYGGWVKFNEVAQPIAEDLDGIFMQENNSASWEGFDMFATSTYLSCYDGVTYLRTPWAPVASTWYNIYCVHNSTNLMMYVNGNLENSTASTKITSSGNFMIGGANISDGFYFNGTIDDVMVFNRSLSAVEIRALYANLSSQYLLNNFTGLAEGNHTFKAYNQDAAGNVNTTETRSVLVDTPTVTMCRTLNQANTVYTQTVDIVPVIESGACINITAQNITLNGNGYWIANSTNTKTRIYSNQYNTTIKNCNLTISSSFSIIQLDGSNDYIYNNTLIGSQAGTNQQGFEFITSNSRIINNTLQGLASFGIEVFGDNNVIDGNNITDTLGFNEDGFALGVNGTNNTIKNNELNDVGHTGIFLGGSYNRIEENTINMLDTASHSIDLGATYASMYVFPSSYNNISNNFINFSSVGLYISSNSPNNNFLNNTLTSFGNNQEDAIEVYSSNNIIEGGWVNPVFGASLAFETRCVYISGGSNNLFKNIKLINSTTNDTFLESTSLNNTFLNVTYNISKEYVGEGSELIRKWYYRAYVNNTAGGNVNNANITAYNSSGSVEFTGLMTNSSGWTNLTTITDYVNNGTLKIYYSNYNIHAINSTYLTRINTFNVTSQGTSESGRNNYKHVFTLQSSNITACQELYSAGTTYTQTANITGTDVNCINITAQNITYNGGGYNISSGSNSAIYSNQYNTTIKNCNLIPTVNYGIYFSSANNSYIYNCSGQVDLTNTYYTRIDKITSIFGKWGGILTLTTSSNNNLTNIYSTGIDNGIVLGSNSNNNYLVNITTINSPDSDGIYFSQASNNILENITSSSNSLEGILLRSSNNNNFTNIFLFDNGYDFVFQNSSNNIIKNANISGGCSSTYTHVEINNLGYVNSTNNIFLNSTYNSSCETISGGAGSQIIRKWYYRAYVNDTSGNNISGVNITVYNSTGSYNFNLTTDSTGYTGLGEIIDYINNGGTRAYYSNYTIYAGNATWPYLNHTFNVTSQGDTSQHNNYKDVFTFSQTAISLVQGWNLIGLSVHNTDTGTNRNISVANNSWSLIGYSSDVEKNLSDINFVNATGNSVNWSTAVSQSKVQAYLVYREDNTNKYVATPDLSMQDTALRENKGYWIKVRDNSGSSDYISIPGAGGSLVGQSYQWSKLRFNNGTKDLNITEAGNATNNWVQPYMYYYDTVGKVPESIDDTGDPDTKNYISSWEGVWVYVKTSGINLIRRNQ